MFIAETTGCMIDEVVIVFVTAVATASSLSAIIGDLKSPVARQTYYGEGTFPRGSGDSHYRIIAHHNHSL